MGDKQREKKIEIKAEWKRDRWEETMSGRKKGRETRVRER